jgi:hypothetical protein
MSPVASRYVALEVSPGFAKANEEQMNAAGTAMRRAHEARVFMDVGSGEGKGEADGKGPRSTLQDANP